jgi:hypothetical protein
MAVPTPFVFIVVVLIALAAFGAFLWMYRRRARPAARADRLRARYESGRISQEEFVRLSRTDPSEKPTLPRS